MLLFLTAIRPKISSRCMQKNEILKLCQYTGMDELFRDKIL